VEETRTDAWAKVLLAASEIDFEILAAASKAAFLGQHAIKKQIAPFLESSEPFPNALLLGEPGIGKTQLARWIAAQRDESFQEHLCPVAPTQLDTTIVLLDECHKQSSPEPLFEMMENRHVTVLGATTRPAQLEPAFRSRFFLELHLMPYPVEEMKEIISYLSGGEVLDETQLLTFASASAGNPRQAERIMLTAERMKSFDPAVVLPTVKITADGLTEMHLKYLDVLSGMKRPVGLSQLATLMYSDTQTVQSIERVLLQYGLIDLAPNGRTISTKGRAYLRRLRNG